jgi:cytochrome c biogenesis protein ResB
MEASQGATRVAGLPDRWSAGADRVLRLLGDARLGVTILLLVGAANVAAALLPGGSTGLEGTAYALLLGALALTSVAAVAVRAPATWREWRRPGPVIGASSLRATIPAIDPDAVQAALRAAGYRTRVTSATAPSRPWAVHGVRRGWSRFSAQASHLGVVVIVLGAGIGAAFGSETTFSLQPGDQALLDAPRPGLSSAVRLDELDARFGPDGRATQLDTHVTFMRDGEPAGDGLLRVNEPGSFDGYLVHPWTYGPTARVRVVTLGGSALLDASVPLDGLQDGVPVGSVELPTAGVTLGLALADATSNRLGVSVVGSDGLADTAHLGPGDEARVGDLVVRFDRFDAWVTFLSRRDPGLAVLFAGGALLCLSLAVAFWWPRRRVSVRRTADGMQVVLRGERFDQPASEFARLVARLTAGA